MLPNSLVIVFKTTLRGWGQGGVVMNYEKVINYLQLFFIRCMLVNNLCIYKESTSLAAENPFASVPQKSAAKRAEIKCNSINILFAWESKNITKKNRGSARAS